MKLLWKKLYAELDKSRNQMKVSWRELARSYDLTASAFTRISKGKPLSARNLVKVLDILEGHHNSKVWEFVKFPKS